MKQLRRVFVSLIVALAVVFTIQWLNSVQENTLGLESFVYFLVLIAVATQLALPLARRWHGLLLTILWIGIYFLLKLTLFTSRPIFGEIHTYITITSAGLLAIMSWLAFRCSRVLNDHEANLKRLVLGRHGNEVHDPESAQALVQAEMLRSRNFSRPLSVISMQTPAQLMQVQIDQLLLEMERSLARQMAYEQLADLIGQHTRRTDVLILDRLMNRLVIICPETDPNAARDLAHQLSKFAGENLGVDLPWGTASFPDEGLTYQTLLEMASKTAAARQTPADRPNKITVSGPAIAHGE